MDKKTAFMNVFEFFGCINQYFLPLPDLFRRKYGLQRVAVSILNLDLPFIYILINMGIRSDALTGFSICTVIAFLVIVKVILRLFFLELQSSH